VTLENGQMNGKKEDRKKKSASASKKRNMDDRHFGHMGKTEEKNLSPKDRKGISLQGKGLDPDRNCKVGGEMTRTLRAHRRGPGKNMGGKLKG